MAHPYLSSDKEWKGKWLLVRVPLDPRHPYTIDLQRGGTCLEWVLLIGAVKLISDLLLWFLARTDGLKYPTLKSWLPNLNYIFLEVILAASSLSNIFDRGEIFFG